MLHRCHAHALLGTLLTVVAADSSSAQVTPEGDFFPVNTFTTGNQARASVAMDVDGDFVVVWDSGRFSPSPGDGDGSGVFARRFTGTGSAVGGEFQVNSLTTGDQFRPAVAISPDGGAFVVVWEGSEQYFFFTSTFLQRFEGTVPQLPEDFPLSSSVGSNQTNPVVFLRDLPGFGANRGEGEIAAARIEHGGSGDGDPCVFDEDSDTDCECGGDDLRTGDRSDRQLIPGTCDPAEAKSGVCGSCGAPSAQLRTGSGETGDGVLSGGRFVANTFTTGYQGRPTACAAEDGSFVVVWASYDQVGPGPSIFGQRFDTATTRVGTEFQVNSHTTGYQYNADVCCDAAGGFVVAWTSRDFAGPPQDGSGSGIFGRRYGSDGMPLGDEFQVNLSTLGDQFGVAVDCDAGGRHIAVWTDLDFSGGIRGRAFDSQGQPIGDPFLARASPTGPIPFGAAVAMADDGRFVVAWDLDGADGDSRGVEARRYSLDTGTTTTRTSTTTVTTTTTGMASTTTLPPLGMCGDPVGNMLAAGVLPPERVITATDALFILLTAVGLRTCEPCVCDIDGSGTIAASDALAALRISTGAGGQLDCPPCV